MKSVLTLFFLLLSLTAFSQSGNYAAARNGLNMRETPDPSGKVLAKIPYGTKLTILDSDKYVEYTAEGLQGGWRKTSYDGKTGYIFDGFLLPIPPPAETKLDDYIKHYYKLISGPVNYKRNSNGDDYNEVEQEIYDKGVYKLTYTGYEYYSESYYIPNMTLQDAFVFCRLFEDFNRFIRTNDSYPLVVGNSTERSVYHMHDFYGNTRVTGIHIDMGEGAYEFLEITYDEGRIVIRTGGGA